MGQEKELSEFERIKKEMLEEKKKAEELGELYSEASENFPEAPTFEQFFENESKGKEYYEKYQGYDHDRSGETEELNRIMEEHEDEQTYRRELLARMFGGKLTARQYATLMRMSADELVLARLN